MEEAKGIRLCILGHSGIGKSPLTKLFKVEGWEPFRVRVPRNDEDAKVCKSPEEYKKLIEKHETERPLYKSPQVSNNHLHVYKDWSFFKVRGKDQCLEHADAAKDKNCSLRIEIFAPILVEMLEHHESIEEAFALKPENLLIILLNPTSQSFNHMDEPSSELCLSTLFATTERDRIQGKGVDLADNLRRVEYLKDELVAWRNLHRILLQHNFVECLQWSHFEFRYSVPLACLANAQAELIRAGSSLLKAVEEQTSPATLVHVKSILRKTEEIMQLTEVV